MKKRNRVVFLAHFVLLAAAAYPALAQIVTGSISGTVTDSSGAAITEANVKLISERAGRTVAASTDGTGRFQFTGLERSAYKLTVTKTGFTTSEIESIPLQAGDSLALGNVTLGVGAVSEVVLVTASAAVVRTESAERGGNLTSDQVNNLLVLGRNITALISLMPGISEAAQSNALNRNGGGFRALGGRTNTNNISVDGIQSTDIDNGSALKLQTSQDAIAEVRILLTNYRAEHGEGSGAVVQMVTKSGSKNFHGNFSYFKKHEQFDANNFFSNRVGLAKPRTRTNTWTYSIGGPIPLGRWNRSREKLFFFFNQEFWPSAAGDNRNLTVPTALERNGDFSQTLDTNDRLIQILDPLNNRAPFAGNRIPQNRLDPNGQALLKMFPNANFFDRSVSRGGYNHVFNAEYGFPNRLETLKVDYNLSEKDQIYGTFSAFNERVFGLSGTSGAFMPNWDQYKVRFWAATKGVANRWTRTISPTTVNELGFSWQGNPERGEPVDGTWPGALRKTWGFNVPMLSDNGNPLGIMPRVLFGGVPNAVNVGSGSIYEWLPMDNPSNLYTVTENLSLVRQKHLYKAGIRVQRFWRDIGGPSRRFGGFQFGPSPLNPLETNYAFSNAAVGVFQSYEESNASPRHFSRGGRYDMFVQDTWKVTRRLTLDYGMRLYYLLPSYMKDDAWATFVPTAYDPAKAVRLLGPGLNASGQRVAVHPTSGQTFSQGAIGAIAPGIGQIFNGMVSPKLDSSIQRGVYKNRGIQWAPRLGFAWDVFGNGKTAIRGGGGVFYNPLVISNYRGLTTQPPLIETPTILFGNLADLRTSSAFRFPNNVRGTNFRGEVPTTMNYSIGVEQNIGFATVVDAAYVGSLSRHLSWAKNLNSIPFGTNFAPASQDPTTGRPLPSALLRPIPGYGDIDYQEMAGTADYHSLQVSVNRRFTRNVQFGLAYTLSRSREFVANDLDRVSLLVPIREWDYGLGAMDQTHALKINWLWDIPKTPWKNSAAKLVLHDWQVSGIASFLSGRPIPVVFTTTTPVDITGSPTDGARLDLRSDPTLPSGERTFARNFHTDAFALPRVGTYGNAGKFPLRGPGVNNWDIAIFKNVPIREQMAIQLRWEMYNAFNHTQFLAFDNAARFTPTGEQVNGAFGQYTAARNPRQMQLGLRFTF